MASDEIMTFHFSSQDEDFDDDMDDGYDQRQTHPHNQSRLSVCTSSTLCGVDEDDEDVDKALTMYVSQLSMESLEGEGDADEEFGDGKELPASDSETEQGSCYSLPATPSQPRNNRVGLTGQTQIPVKYYASDNETKKGGTKGNKSPRRRRRSRRMRREKGDEWEKVRNKSEKKEEEQVSHELSGESDQSGGGRGLMVITRPKGGRRSLCMDMEEVKACRDLGFELEHERMLDLPSRLSLSTSTLDTSSGGNSPISSWRISSPGNTLSYEYIYI